jgi:AraC-like DNA-binding protein
VSQRKVYALTLRKVRSYLVGRGIDETALLAATELAHGDLDDPYRLISEDQARRFYRNAVDLADESALGLEIGWTTNLSEMGPSGLMQLVARTVREAVEAGSTTGQTYYGFVDYRYEERGDTTVFSLECPEHYSPLRIFALERAMGVFQACCEELVGADARPLKVLVDYPAPAHVNRYREILRCPIYFEQESVEIHYPREYLDRELASYDPAALEALRLLQATLVNKLSASKDVVSEVRLLLRRTPGEFPSLEQVADCLAMSPRTLRRKLGAAHTRFQDVLDAERRRVAEDYLANSDLTVQQIAALCGFSDAQNFSQAFKRWLGMPPSAYRQMKRD